MVLRPTPSYPLEEIQAAVRHGRYLVTRRAAGDAAGLYFDEDDVKQCVLELLDEDFYKSMASRRIPGRWQDVYRRRYLGVAIYLKVQMTADGRAVVISFKGDESA